MIIYDCMSSECVHIYNTLYGRCIEYGLLEDPTEDMSDEEVVSPFQQIREDAPFSGVQMLCGARGVRVARDQVSSLL